MSDEFEQKVQTCNSLKDLRSTYDSNREDVSKTLQPVIDLLENIIYRLQLKGEAFETYSAVSDDGIEALWEILKQIDETLTMSDTTKSANKDRSNLLHFISHCCQISHYSFQIKKCGKPECKTCKPVRMDTLTLLLFTSSQTLFLVLMTTTSHLKKYMVRAGPDPGNVV